MITVTEAKILELEKHGEVNNGRSYLITLPRPEIIKKRVAVLIDASYSMEGKLLYNSVRNVEELINFFNLYSVKYRLYIFYKEVQEIDLAELKNIKPKSGTNLRNLIEFLVEKRDEYDIAIVFTDGIPTVGPKSLQKIVSGIDNIQVIEGALIIVNPNNNIEGVENLAKALKARVVSVLGESLFDNIAHLLVESQIVPSLILRLGFGHPEWIRIDAPFVEKGENGWSISNVTYFQLYNIPVPVRVVSSVKKEEGIGIPVMIKKLYYENGKKFQWKLGGLLEYT